MSQTKLDESFTTSKPHLHGHDIKATKNRKNYSPGLIKVVERGFICNCSKCKSQNSVNIFALTLKFLIKKNLLQNNVNLDSFSDEITISLSKTSLKYENLIIMKDFNINTKTKVIGQQSFEAFRNLFAIRQR